MNPHTCFPGAPSPWGPILDSEFQIPCPRGTCNPGRINAWAGFPACATGGHGEVHQSRRGPHYRIVWGEEWEDDGYMKLNCTSRVGRFSHLRFNRMTTVSESWK